MGDIVPREEVSREGMRAIGGIVGGAGLLLLSLLGPTVGLIVGGALAAIGVGISVSKKDRVAGGVVAAAGGLTVLSKLIGPGGGLLVVGGAGLFAYGVMSAFRFFRKLKTRT